MPSNESEFSIDWVPEAIVVIDPAGGIVDINRAAETLFGYRREELLDHTVDTLLPGGNDLPLLEPAGEAAVPIVRSADAACLHRDGSRFAASLRWFDIPRVGRIVISVREPETPRAGASGEAMAALQQHRDFFSLFNHDVRQSLQSIQFICDSMADTVPEAAATIGEIVGSVKTLLDMILRLGDAGPIRAAEERCVVGELLQALGRELQPIAQRKGLELVVENAPQEIRTDPVLLRELLQNLMANAVRYTSRGSVRVGCSTAASSVRVDIVDTGVGIDDEKLRELFADPQANLRPRGGGAGLGLAIARRLADVLGCRIEASSESGRGSRFTVVVPRAGVRREPLRSPGRRDPREQSRRH
jgi:PAS domain S-box-containing protein